MNIKNLIKLLGMLLVFVLCATVVTACTTDGAGEATTEGTTAAPDETTAEGTEADPNEVKYTNALDLLEKGDYVGAHALFAELGDYKDAAKMAARFRYVPTTILDKYVTADGERIENATFTYNENNLPATCVYATEDGYQHTCIFSYNERFQLTKVACTDTTGLDEYWEEEYDEKGNLLREEFAYSDETLDTYVYTYNEKGYKATMEASFSDGTSYSCVYTHDENGNEILCVMTQGDSTITYEREYDADGKLLTETQKDQDGNESVKTLYAYDEKGHEISQTFIINGQEAGSFEYEYNDQGQLIRETYNLGGGMTIINEFEYDANGNIFKGRQKNADNAEQSRDVAYKLVYIPYDLTAEDWKAITDDVLGW